MDVKSSRIKLRNIDPWKTVAEIREANRGAGPKKLEKDISESIKAVRKQARSGK